MTANRAALLLFSLVLASQACRQEPGAATSAADSAAYCEARRLQQLGCARPDSSGWRFQPVSADGLSAGMNGELRCQDGRPKLEEPRPGLSGDERAENIRHEATHGSQFAANCDSVLSLWKKDDAYRLALESEATCRGLAVYSDSVRRIRKGQQTATLTRLYLPTFGYEDVAASLDEWCGA